MKNISVKISKVICTCLLSQNHEVENDHDLAIFVSVTGAVIWKIIKLDTRQGNINKWAKPKGVLKLGFFFINVLPFVSVFSFLVC